MANRMSSSSSSPISRWLRGPALLALVLAATLRAAPAPRIVAVGDVHGAGDAFASILQKTGLIDAQKRWTGGTAILVQTGDLLDRGQDVRQILDLLMALESQAAAAGGRVHSLLGNHELMNLIGETRDVAPDLYRRFADGRSEQKREDAFQTASKIAGGSAIDKAEWMAAHPLGYVEYREALSASAPYGKWLRSKPIIADVGDTIFMHGGINLDFTSESVDNINKRVRKELTEFEDGFRWLQQHDLAAPFSTLGEIARAAQDEWAKLDAKRKRDALTEEDVNEAKLLLPILKIDASAILNPNGPLWFRGYSTWTDQEGSERMPALLKKYKVKRFVTAHTPQPSGQITTRFGNTLYLIDTGMLNGKFYPGGRPSALEIDGEKVTPIYVDR
jgi:calcineurin-like phosphoesterase family protein